MSKALVLAAGKSVRISSVASQQPKPLLKINGIPILVHNLMLLSKHKFQEIWINLHYQADLIKNDIGNGRKLGLSVHYSFEEQILGTAGALKHLEKRFSDENFLVLYGDNLTNCNLTGLLQFHKDSEGIGTIAVYDPNETLNSGIAGGRVQVKADGTVESFVEGNTPSVPPLVPASLNFLGSGIPPMREKGEEGGFVNAGAYALSPEILKYIPDGFSDFGKDIFPSILKKGIKLSAYKMKKGYCLGIDTPETYARTQEIAKSLFPSTKRGVQQGRGVL